jgi:hypothetical protein
VVVRVVVEVVVVREHKVHLPNDGFEVPALTWMRIQMWARHRVRSYSEAARDVRSDGLKMGQRAHHNFDLLPRTWQDVVSAPRAETRTVILVVGTATIALLAARLVFAQLVLLC